MWLDGSRAHSEMIVTAQILVLLLIAIAAVAIVAARLKIPSAILLVITGVALALLPGLPAVQIAPDVLLLLVLPPVIYSSAVAMSWREFRFNLRPISLLAVGCVVFTTVAVAAASHWVIGLSWQVGFVLGAIVSPPDAVAPLSIARRMCLPRRITVILEGEGLANDATALILYRFAVAAAVGGAFSIGHAVGTFITIVIGEVLWGIATGWLMLRLRRWVRDPRIEILLSVLTPFVAYWPPQHLGGSGVLATVTTGLYISWNGLRLISAPTRLQGIFFWDFLMYVIEGMVFLLTGLQARTLFAGVKSYPAKELVISAAVVSVVVIATRFIWMYPATYLPRWLVPAIARKDPAPPWQWPFVLAFTGVRGIVSLAAALAIPFEIDTGVPFPHRDLVLLLTFVIVMVTLVGQGLTLPWVIRKLGLANAGRRERLEGRAAEIEARRRAVESVIERLDRLAAENRLPEEICARLRAHHRERLKGIELRIYDDEGHKERVNLLDGIELEVVNAEREFINDLYSRGELKDEARRRIERGLDLREAELANLRDEAGS
jgi:monovalent cation/hydrogen antiporter